MQKIAQGMNNYLKLPGTGDLDHLAESEAKQLIGKAPDRTKQLIFKLHWHTGARISEILSLTPSSIDFEDGLVTIERKKRSDGAVQHLPLPRALVSDLRIYIGDAVWIQTNRLSKSIERPPGKGRRIVGRRSWIEKSRLICFVTAERIISCPGTCRRRL